MPQSYHDLIIPAVQSLLLGAIFLTPMVAYIDSMVFTYKTRKSIDTQVAVNKNYINIIADVLRIDRRGAFTYLVENSRCLNNIIKVVINDNIGAEYNKVVYYFILPKKYSADKVINGIEEGDFSLTHNQYYVSRHGNNVYIAGDKNELKNMVGKYTNLYLLYLLLLIAAHIVLYYIELYY